MVSQNSFTADVTFFTVSGTLAAPIISSRFQNADIIGKIETAALVMVGDEMTCTECNITVTSPDLGASPGKCDGLIVGEGHMEELLVVILLITFLSLMGLITLLLCLVARVALLLMVCQ